MAVSRCPLTAIASAPAAHSPFTTTCRSTSCTRSVGSTTSGSSEGASVRTIRRPRPVDRHDARPRPRSALDLVPHGLARRRRGPRPAACDLVGEVVDLGLESRRPSSLRSLDLRLEELAGLLRRARGLPQRDRGRGRAETEHDRERDERRRPTARSVAGARPGGPAGRCLGVAGVERASVDLGEERHRGVRAALGRRVASEPCRGRHAGSAGCAQEVAAPGAR